MILQPSFWNKVPLGKLVGIEKIKNMNDVEIEAVIWVYFDKQPRCSYFDCNGRYIGEADGPRYDTLEAIKVG